MTDYPIADSTSYFSESLAAGLIRKSRSHIQTMEVVVGELLLLLLRVRVQLIGHL
eukprot:COSAG05_NODE_22_length_32312_cov_23.410890_6_plen_55_part_00